MKKGFTLIELLIVIIIIGILATMALPQYQKMVNRAKWGEAVSLASAVKSAENLYYAENSQAAWANDLDQLNTLALPAAANRNFYFSVATQPMIYAASKNATSIMGVGDDFTSGQLAGATPYFRIDLNTNATGYGANAPGNLT